MVFFHKTETEFWLLRTVHIYRLKIHKMLSDMLQKAFCNRRKYLILFPDQVQFRFQRRGQRTKHQTGARRCINQPIQGEQISKTFLRKHGGIIRQPKRTFQAKILNPFPAPGRYIICANITRTQGFKATRVALLVDQIVYNNRFFA